MKKNKKWIIFLLCLFITDAQAYVSLYMFGNQVKWDQTWVEFKMSPTSFTPGSPWTNQINTSVGVWNNAFNNVNYWTSSDSSNINNHLNDENSIAFVGNDCSEWLGITFPWFNVVNGKMKGADIWFDNDCPYVPSLPNEENEGISYGTASLKGVALHEFGHTLFLDHSWEHVSIMNYGGNFERLMADDYHAGHDMYGHKSRVDVTVSTQLDMPTTDVTSGYLASVWVVFDSEPSPETVYVEHTVLNNGDSLQQNVPVNFYIQNVLDPNQTIDIGSVSYDLPAHSEGTFVSAFTIPSYVNNGQYKIGFMIDPENTIDEHDESNNDLWIPNSEFYVGVSTLDIESTFSNGSDLIQVVPGQTIQYNTEICNNGFELVMDGMGSIESSLPGYVSVPLSFSFLQPGQCSSQTHSMYIPTQVLEGQQFYIGSYINDYFVDNNIPYVTDPGSFVYVQIINPFPDHTTELK